MTLNIDFNLENGSLTIEAEPENLFNPELDLDHGEIELNFYPNYLSQTTKLDKAQEVLNIIRQKSNLLNSFLDAVWDTISSRNRENFFYVYFKASHVFDDSILDLVFQTLAVVVSQDEVDWLNQSFSLMRVIDDAFDDLSF